MIRAYRISTEDQLLIERASELAKRRMSERKSVAAALKTKDKRVFQGVNIEVSGSALCSKGHRSCVREVENLKHESNVWSYSGGLLLVLR